MRHSYGFRLSSPHTRHATHCNRSSSTDKTSRIKPKYVQLQKLDLPFGLPIATRPIRGMTSKRNDATVKPITRGDLLLTDPRGFDDFLSSDLLQEEIGRDCRGNNLYFLPTFVHRSLVTSLFMDPLVDALLTRSFAESDPKEERLLLRVLQTLCYLQ